MMLLLGRLISLLPLLLGTKVETLFPLRMLLIFLTLRLIRRFVVNSMLQELQLRLVDIKLNLVAHTQRSVAI
ncbi:hypothetical protein YYU_01110 [Anaplasma phagocytophilum str. HZ2]|nr:hypothetical protein YYU_01110 [Anaplasma phagocytophilum str. HZ2]AGR80490.1 hypothetical protein WSQ_01100 [Anaplasma phagocytophilum str. JM]AGR81748.1 hypothetical protein YYY_01115 [Anaplasma phagocytophilum str. Dog2]PLC09752.1 hypothetical protein C0V68_05065 [Anaplasma phagocytophilum]